MTEPRILVCSHLPPLDAGAAAPRPAPTALDMPRLGRLFACLVALALPVTGLVAADTVHRVDGPGTLQAAASGSPLPGAAVSDGASRTRGRAREALIQTANADFRPLSLRP